MGAFARGSGYQTGVGAVVGERVGAYPREQEDSFFFSIAARAITALTVVSSGGQLLDLNIVGGNKTKNTKQHQKPTNKTQTTTPKTKQTPKKSEMDVSETVKRSKLPLRASQVFPTMK